MHHDAENFGLLPKIFTTPLKTMSLVSFRPSFVVHKIHSDDPDSEHAKCGGVLRHHFQLRYPVFAPLIPIVYITSYFFPVYRETGYSRFARRRRSHRNYPIPFGTVVVLTETYRLESVRRGSIPSVGGWEPPNKNLFL
jgi:hypothetical protein